MVERQTHILVCPGSIPGPATDNQVCHYLVAYPWLKGHGSIEG